MFKSTVLCVALFLFFINSEAQNIKILFDASKAETAGNADWVIDADAHNLGFGSGPASLNNGNESNAQKIPTAAQSGITASTSETFWNGALSYWGIDCVNRGYTVETLPYNGQITYGNSSNTQDLSNYKVFVVCEPNILFTTAEKTAIINFVQNGGGLMIVADHDVSDRNNDNSDSPAIWNDLMSNNTVQANPFGFIFDLANFSQTTSNIPSLPGDSILNGPAGNVTQVQFSGGTTMTLFPAANSTVKGVVYKTGSAFGNTNVMVAYSRFGNGKVAAIGDSSPCDDGTGDPNDVLFTGYTGDASGNHRKLLMNMIIWLASTSSGSAPVANFTASSTTICVGQSTTFTSSSTGTISSYSWNFGSGASPATATSVGPHTVTYSTSGTKTVTLTVTNSNGSNTMTKTAYITVDGGCVSVDAGAIALLNPVPMNCPANAVPVQVQIKNYGSGTLNFSSTPVTVNLTAKNPSNVTTNLSKVVNTGTLASGSTLDLTFAATYDLNIVGNYIFNASTSLTGDLNSSNDAMIADTIYVGPGFQTDYTVVAEDMGTVTATTAIATHETNNGFANVNLTFSGTADVRNTTNSTGYSGASGGANVFFTNSAGRFLLISGINTTGMNDLRLSFGMLKSLSGSTGSEISLQVSSDGVNFTSLTIPSLGSSTAWNYVVANGTIPATPTLYIKFTQTVSTGVQFRIDDILLYDHITSPSVSTGGPTTFCQGNSVTMNASNASSYLWSNGATTQSINATTSGSYSVTLTNSLGCTATAGPVAVTVKPTYSISRTRYIAQGSSYTLPNGQIVSTGGTYTTSLLTTGGCDSSIVTTLILVNANDNSLCTNDAVDSLTGTVSHTAVNVDDGNPCTIDGCDPLTGVYHNPAVEICGNGIDDNCNGLIDEGCPVTLSLKVYIEGLYNSSGTMTASVNPISNPTLCDTITVELHSTTSPYSLLYSVKGTIDVNGNGSFVFSAARAFSYYIVVKHRNALSVWSASSVLLNAATISYNFSDVANKAFGSNMKQLAVGVYGMYSGDVDQNGSITLTDFTDAENKARNFTIGYSLDDVTGNSFVESADCSLVENNIGKSVSKP